MDCLHSMAPSDDELLRHALDGESLPTQAREHLSWCKGCQTRLERYGCTNTFLLKQMYRSQCPDSTQLSHYCAGMLPGDDRQSITEHLEQCPLCASEVINTRKYLDEFECVSPEPPTSGPQIATHNRRDRRIPGYVPLRTCAGSGAERESSWPQQYRTEEINISLHLSRSSNGEIILLGLISSTCAEDNVYTFAHARIELHSSIDSTKQQQRANRWNDPGVMGRESTLATQIDERGNLALKGVPRGTYYLIIYLPERELVIEDIQIT